MKHMLCKKMQRINIEPLIDKHIEELRNLRNCDENRKWFKNSDIITEEQQKNWYNLYLLKENDIMFAITLLSNNIFVGTAALYDIDRVNGTCEFGRIILDKKKLEGKGWGREVMQEIISIASEELKIKKLYLEVMRENERAISLYEKVGFKMEEIEEEYIKMKLEI